ncbi:MAG: hypothetical protein AAB263_05565, partial [Planctomycetota bacterium]
MALIVDDMAVRALHPGAGNGSRESQAHVAAICDALAPAGVNMRGTKERWLSAAGVTWTIYGGALVAYAGSAGVVPAIPRAVRDYVRSLDVLQRCDAALQDKMLLVRYYNKRAAYFFGATKPEVSAQWRRQIGDATLGALQHILDADIPVPAWWHIHCGFNHAGAGLVDLDAADLLFDEYSARTQEMERELHATRETPWQARVRARWEGTRQCHRFAYSGMAWRYNPLALYPTVRGFTLGDAAFRRALRMQLDMPEKLDNFVCVDHWSEKAAAPTRLVAPDHHQVCSSCTRCVRYQRHEVLQAAFLRVCKLYGRPVSPNVRGLLKHSTVGEDLIPDAFFYRGGPEGPCTVFFDFTVAHATVNPINNTADTKRVQAAYTGKITKYAPLVNDPAARKNGKQCRELQPIVFTTLGLPSYDTAEYLESLGKGLRHGFARELVGTCTVAILEQQAAAYQEWFRLDTAVLRASPHQREPAVVVRKGKHDRDGPVAAAQAPTTPVTARSKQHRAEPGAASQPRQQLSEQPQQQQQQQ